MNAAYACETVERKTVTRKYYKRETKTRKYYKRETKDVNKETTDENEGRKQQRETARVCVPSI